MTKISWKSWIFIAFVAVALVMFGTACPTSGQEQKSNAENAERMHNEEGEHVHGEETNTQDQEEEEAGEKLALTDTYDQVHNGVRLVLAYHNASSSFIGSVENVTDKTIKKVRVEVHLSTGVELEPTERQDLAPGEKAGIKIEATGHVFEWWKAHAETGNSENIH